jgi:hypothetical protein
VFWLLNNPYLFARILLKNLFVKKSRKESRNRKENSLNMLKKGPFLSLLLALALLASACASAQPEVATVAPTSPPSPTPLPTQAPATLAPTAAQPPAPTVAPTQVSTSLPPTQTAGGLTFDVLKNAEYKLPVSNKTVRLAGGSYTAGSGADYISANLMDKVAFGDLNGDGKPDSAILLAENTGGSGTFISLVVVLDENGQPVQTSSALIGDRAKIDSVTIGPDRKIVVTGAVQGPNDPMCCPTLQVTETYQLTKAGLEMVRLTSQTPDGKERAINIESPANGAQVSGSVEVKGNVTIAPFENNLVYRIFDGTGKKWAEGSVNVKAADMGGPGTFDTTIDIASIPPGILIRLEILDLSAADSSILAMDSVELLVK